MEFRAYHLMILDKHLLSIIFALIRVLNKHLLNKYMNRLGHLEKE